MVHPANGLDPGFHVINIKKLLFLLFNKLINGFSLCLIYFAVHRELLYFAFERFLNTMYQSFQIYVGQVRRKAATESLGADLAAITEMEIQ